MNAPLTQTDRHRLAALAVRAIEAEPAERERVILELTADCPHLREALADVVTESTSQLDDDPLADLAEAFKLAIADEDLADPLDLSGTTIDRYALIRRLGAGAYGVVYLAEQQQPVHRTVALKIIKPGMDTSSVLARFGQERQVLALMDHTSIARIFDGGATAQGLPYFVMEYVDGAPITTFCDSHQLDVRERLKLFLSVCEAVQHVHIKGVIHRDLKPSNILVTQTTDGAPHAKVIDFGIAKALHGPVTPLATLTRRDEFVGTLEYMSPEQASAGPLDVDTRADVYSLGAVLYELLTGMLPFDPRELHDRTEAEAREFISTKEPPRPGSRVANAGNTAADVATRRSTTPAALVDTLRRELEWIPMYALRKDRGERYQSVQQLADDVRAYLEGMALAAGPESASYRVRKFARRHRAALVVLAILMAALSIGAAGLFAGMVRAQRALAVADDRATQLDRLSTFLETIFGGIDPVVARGLDRELLLRVLASAEAAMGESTLDAAQEFRVRLMLAEAYLALDEAERGRPHIDRSGQLLSIVPTDDARLARLYKYQFWLLKHDDRLAEGEAHLRMLVDHCDAQIGRTSAQSIEAVCWLADIIAQQKDRVAERDSEIRFLLKDAESRAIEGFGEGSQKHADALHAASTVLHFVKPPAKAEAAEAGKRAVQMYSATAGPDSAQTIEATARLASHYLFLPDYNECIALYRQVLEPAQRVLGKTNHMTISIHGGLGRALLWRAQAEDLDDAIRHLAIAADFYSSAGPHQRGDYLSAANWLVIAMVKAEDLENAIARAREASAVAVEIGHAQAFNAIVPVVAERSGAIGQDATAEEFLKAMHAKATTLHAENAALVRGTAAALVTFYKRTGDQEAEQLWARRRDGTDG